MADVTMAMYTHIEAEIFLPIADLKDAIRAQTQLPDHLWYQTKCEDALAQVMQLLADLDAGWRHP
jgi:hypothetical protein